MWEFVGDIEYICNHCGDNDSISVKDFNVESIGGSERGMGQENIYEISHHLECLECDKPILLSFEASEYPAELLNFVINNSTGAETSGEPDIGYLREIYSARDLVDLYESIGELIIGLQSSPELMREITPREFEKVVTELFRGKGFEVGLTQRTKDGGKDIIAIHTDSMGIKSKYFIECKRHSEKNKVGVTLVRALQGVKNIKDGPNKTILVTTSTFTKYAKEFVEYEASSKWDITLADYNVLINWLNDYDVTLSDRDS